MNPKIQTLLLVVAALGFGIAGGYFVGARSKAEPTNGDQKELVHILKLGNATTKTDECARLLEGFRSGQQDLMMSRLESLLDFALIDLAREYSPERDPYGSASKVLEVAKKYRAAHPHRSELADVAKQVDAALALTTKAAQ
jgi:hypothetical protein